MAAKIAFLILSIALIGAALLSVRQQRLQLVHEMTEHLQRAEQTQRAEWRVRADLAARITPARIRASIEHQSSEESHGERFRPVGSVVFANWNDEPEELRGE